jgi:hypothetical protein
MHVATEQSYEHTYNFPLIIEGLPDEYVLGAPLPDSVGVVLEGRGKNLIKAIFSDGAVVIDGSGFKYSERFFDLHDAELRLPEDNFRLMRFTRTEPVRLVIDRYTNNEVPVVSSLYLESSEGFAAISEKTVFNPENVIIGGPERLVRSVEFVKTVSDTFRNLNASTTVVVDINREFDLLEYTPDLVSAKIVVEPLIKKRFEGIEVEVKGGNPGENEVLDPRKIDIVFEGIAEEIDSLEPDDIRVFVDYEPEHGDNRLRPVIIHPSGVDVVSKTPENFRFKKK